MTGSLIAGWNLELVGIEAEMITKHLVDASILAQEVLK